MADRVLVVDDDATVRDVVARYLGDAGYRVEVAADGESALEAAAQARPDAVVLDLMLPGTSGLDVCRSLRAGQAPPAIVMLTALGEEDDRIRGLELGADDYVTKPFSLRELRARVRAHLRRAARADERVSAFGDCEVDFDRAELRRGGAQVDVTPQELKLLEVFLRNEGRVLTRERIISAAWGPGMAITDRAVDTHVFNLRKKVEPIPAEPRHLVGVRGIGYRFDG
jgi:DNA-binding response OmpR family regulator